jgi:hypothetical protein
MAITADIFLAFAQSIDMSVILKRDDSETETRSFYWAHLRRLHLKTEDRNQSKKPCGLIRRHGYGQYPEL